MYFVLFALVRSAPQMALTGIMIILGWFSIAWVAAIAQWVYCRYRQQHGRAVGIPLMVVAACYVALFTGVIYGYFPAV